MERHVLSSTAVAVASYDKQSAILEIEFRNGDTYRYFMVPDSVFRGLLAAESKGRFVHESIIDHFPFLRERDATK